MKKFSLVILLYVVCTLQSTKRTMTLRTHFPDYGTRIPVSMGPYATLLPTGAKQVSFSSQDSSVLLVLPTIRVTTHAVCEWGVVGTWVAMSSHH